MLAYVFWHRPRATVDRELYEDSLRTFHAMVETPSAGFRLAVLPFAGTDGYEDWYLVDDWQGLGALNGRAVDDRHRAAHDAVALLTGESWGSVYQLLRGPAEIPETADWLGKPRGQSYGDFLSSLPAAAVWRRQMVLGPAPEFCVEPGASEARTRL